MLIFKTNIYENKMDPNPLSDPNSPPLKLKNFIELSLKNGLEFLINLEQSQETNHLKKLKKYYPRTHQFATPSTIQKLLTNLIEGLLDCDTWFRLNTYHFCLLYDCLLWQTNLYNSNNLKDKLRIHPEMKGKPIDFIDLADKLFFNTVFLMSMKHFDNLSREDKNELGFTCPAQFGVIHQLPPSKDEMKLLPEPGFSYTMTV